MRPCSRRLGPLEACCSIGLGIIPGRTQEIDAQSLNTGRVLCNYLARFGQFASVFDRKELSETTWPPFDALLLVSNEVVGFLQSESSLIPSQEDAERAANQYIAQQIFGVLMAQSLPEDFEDHQEWNLWLPRRRQADRQGRGGGTHTDDGGHDGVPQARPGRPEEQPQRNQRRGACAVRPRIRNG